MSFVLDVFHQAVDVLTGPESEVWDVLALTLQVSGAATLTSLILGIAGGVALALGSFPGRKILITFVNTGMALPPVIAGLVVSLFLWRSGPLGSLNIIYTPTAMVIAQTCLATPIIMGVSLAAIQQLPNNLRFQIAALGATRFQALFLIVREARLPLLAAVMAGFGGAISEVGASMMVGGNIKGHTRVLTTAVVMETGKGNFDLAIGLGFILMMATFIVTLILTLIQQRKRPR